MCSEVEQRFLLYLAANSSALDQAKGSIGFVGGAAGRCLGYKHSPILAKSKPLWESKIDFRLILWDNIENPGFHINKINVLPTPNRQNRLFIAGKCGTWVKVDRQIRNLCGWVLPGEIPSESTFSRAFAEFAESNIPGQIHKAMIEEATKQGIIGHISRDSTAIHAHEKPTPKCKSDQKPMKHKRGRPRKDELRPPKAKTRLERQASGEMTLEQMLDELPKVFDRGAKVNAQGFRNGWIGYKFHIDATDAGLPVSCILSSASLHDSQVAIPLSDMTAQRVTYLYECMDSAYDAVQIHDHSEKHGRISIIDTNPRSNKDLKESLARERKAADSAGFIHPTDQRYGERTVVERVNGRLKDDFGARHLRVRGHKKVQAHLSFGIVALCADQIIRLLT